MTKGKLFVYAMSTPKAYLELGIDVQGKLRE